MDFPVTLLFVSSAVFGCIGLVFALEAVTAGRQIVPAAISALCFISALLLMTPIALKVL